VTYVWTSHHVLMDCHGATCQRQQWDPCHVWIEMHDWTMTKTLLHVTYLDHSLEHWKNTHQSRRIIQLEI